MANLPIDFRYSYALLLPDGRVWRFDNLFEGAQPFSKTNGGINDIGVVTIPVDLITAARLNLIRPGDDSGINDEQWAWLKILGFSGEYR